MRLISMIILTIVMSCKPTDNTLKVSSNKNQILKSTSTITVDGKPDDAPWSSVEWENIDQVWLGAELSNKDFSGKYKTLWSEDSLYVLALIEDDVLVDTHHDPLVSYWDDDCLEIFIDENASGGNHQYNHNAFAYHIGLDNTVVDIGPDSIAHIYPHINSKRVTTGTTTYWELSMALYDDSYIDNGSNQAVKLTENKEIGFAIAYCDNDSSSEREHFIGSENVQGEDKNRGWIDASIFRKRILKTK